MKASRTWVLVCLTTLTVVAGMYGIGPYHYLVFGNAVRADLVAPIERCDTYARSYQQCQTCSRECRTFYNLLLKQCQFPPVGACSNERGRRT